MIRRPRPRVRISNLHDNRALESMEPRLLFTGTMLLPNPALVSDVSGSPSTVVADFNNDGHPDVGEAVPGDLVRVLLGNGTGTLTPLASFAAGGTRATGIAAADFNGDGNVDLADVFYTSNTTTIFFGNGDGTFTGPNTYSTGGHNPSAIAVGDINADGHPDLIIANSDGNGSGSGQGVAVLLNQGNGTFAAPALYDSGAFPFKIVVGDLNHDGRADVVISKSNGGVVDVLLANADGTLGAPVTHLLGSRLQNMRPADVNGDGAPDLLISSGGMLRVLLNQGAGVFTPAAQPIDIGIERLPVDVVGGDFDGNGTLDLAVVDFDFANLVDRIYGVIVLAGDGLGNFATPVTYVESTNNQYAALATGDFNADGSADLVFSDYSNLHLALGRSISPITHPLSARVGHSPVNVLAHFTDNLPGASAADYAASIDWGDGQTDAGLVVTSSTGGFDVVSSHPYATPGLFTAHVTLTATDGASRTSTAAITISRHRSPPPPVPIPVPVPRPLPPVAQVGVWHKLNQLQRSRADRRK